MIKKIFGGFATLPIWIKRIVLIAPILFILTGVPQLFEKHGVKNWAVDESPVLVQTYTYVRGQGLPDKVFYGKAYASIDGVPTLSGYWENNGKKWVYIEAIKGFPAGEWGPVAVIWRTPQ